MEETVSRCEGVGPFGRIETGGGCYEPWVITGRYGSYSQIA